MIFANSQNALGLPLPLTFASGLHFTYVDNSKFHGHGLHIESWPSKSTNRFYITIYSFEDPAGLSISVSKSFFFRWKFLTNCLTAKSSITSSLPPGILAPGISRKIPTPKSACVRISQGHDLLSATSPWPLFVYPFPPCRSTAVLATNSSTMPACAFASAVKPPSSLFASSSLNFVIQ